MTYESETPWFWIGLASVGSIISFIFSFIAAFFFVEPLAVYGPFLMGVFLLILAILVWVRSKTWSPLD